MVQCIQNKIISQIKIIFKCNEKKKGKEAKQTNK